MCTQLYAQNTNPAVSNVAFSISGTIVIVTYDVTDAEQNTVTVGMEVSSNNGATWNYNFGSATGDIGPNISIGNNRTITWNYSDGYNPNFMIRIIANDETADGNNCGKIYYGGGPNIDGDGAYYNTILIGTQCWMKENLNVGIMIDGSVNQMNNGIIEKYYHNNDSVTSANLGWGALYQWDEAMQYVTTPGTQGICPSEWHIPTSEEFEILFSAVNGNGNTLKAIGQDGASTNTSGFSALFGGFRSDDGAWREGSNSFYSWISKEDVDNVNFADYRRLDTGSSTFVLVHNYKTFGLSVRCIRNF